MSKPKYILYAIVGYMFYEVFQIFQLCMPPLADQSAVALRPQFKPTDKLEFKVYLFSKAEKKRHKIASFTAMPSWDAELSSVKIIENFTIPWADKNATAMTEVVALANGKEFNRRRLPLSRYMVPMDERDGKRSLFHDPSGKLQQERIRKYGDPKVRASIPHIIEVGFVLEERNLNGQDLRNRGFAGYIKDDYFEIPLHLNTFVTPRDEYVPCDQKFAFELRFRVIGFGFWMAQKMFTDVFAEVENTLGMSSYDIDSFKMLVSGANPVKLMVVYFVAILHFILEYMVIAADVSFWKEKTSFVGLSQSTITLGLGMKLISVLYVIEDGRTRLVLYILLARLSLDVWKWLKLNKASTNEHWASVDEMRDMKSGEKKLMFYTFLALMPFIFAFAGYRLAFNNFKSWYSFFILTLATCSQTFGFVIMLPQVFLNYRLKSVEHLPWRALTYQAINTFVDDVFTLCIRMPEVQKYSAFRDDIVFFICLYQRYLYKNRRTDIEPKTMEDKKDD